eukprot:gb/GECH01002541.1/.p1 GENE.gb/GECH01002541.1/~~gb/GECH01002541.1/.p1  ORF type:complete len:333 (+),score=61.58 gb/GECH01002541.1/:1-999(+)
MTSVENDVAFVREMLSGGFAGCFADSLFHPLETVKTRMQSQAEKGGLRKYRSTLNAFTTIFREEGVKALYGGIGGTFVGSLPASAAYFTVYEWMKNITTPLASSDLAESSCYLFAGALAEVAASTLCVPLEVVKLRMQLAQGSTAGVKPSPFSTVSTAAGRTRRTTSTKDTLLVKENYRYRNVFHGLSQVYRLEGVAGLYTGLWATMVRDVPYSALYFLLYERLKQRVLLARTGSAMGDLGAQDTLVVSGTAGGVAAFLSNPLDLIKTRMQTQSHRYTGVTATVRKVAREEGLPAFFKGSHTRVVWISSVMSVTFVALQQMRHFLSDKGIAY